VEGLAGAALSFGGRFSAMTAATGCLLAAVITGFPPCSLISI
jgi:hypothetical protein